MLIKTHLLAKTYHNRKGGEVFAVKDANLTIAQGETVGILGESGSGKSTLGQMLVGQIKPSSGALFYQEEQIAYPFRGVPRKEIQILFQHPEVSFNPRLTLQKSLMEPYRFHRLEFSKKILLEDIRRFGLYEEHLGRYPSELSGGELQRAALARILTLHPKLIVLDEPTSMLDVISQAQVIAILRQVQQIEGTAYLFITHNVTLCETFANRIYTIQSGILTNYRKEGI